MYVHLYFTISAWILVQFSDSLSLTLSFNQQPTMALFCTVSEAMCSCLQINRGEKEDAFIVFLPKRNFFVYPNLIAGMSENPNPVQYLYLWKGGHMTACVCLSVRNSKNYEGDFYEIFGKRLWGQRSLPFGELFSNSFNWKPIDFWS